MHDHPMEQLDFDSTPETDDLAPRVYTVTEAARLLRISRAFAYELVATGELPSLRLGRRVVVPRRALDDLIDAKR